MNIWIKRSLSTAAITGGVLLAGAAAASADDHSSDATKEHSSLSSPLEVGGISAGSHSEKSSSHTTTSSSQDGDRSAQESHTTGHTSKQSTGLKTGSITIDPAASSDRSQASTEHRSDDGDRDRSSTSASENKGSASAPIHVGGVSVSTRSDASDQDTSSSSAQDGDRSREHRTSDESQRSSGSSVGTGALDIDPRAAFGQSSRASSDRLGDDDRNSSSSSQEGAASLPIRFGGITTSFANDRSSAQQQSDAARQGDRAELSEHRTEDATSSRGGFTVGEITGDPSAAISQGGHSADQRETGFDDASTTGRSHSHVKASGPVSFEGLRGALATTDEHSTADAEQARDGDRVRTHADRSNRSNDAATQFAGGAFAFAPSFSSSQDKNDASDVFGDDVRSAGTSTNSGSYAFPFRAESSNLTTDTTRANQREVIEQIVDGDRSRTTTDHDADVQHDRSFYGLEGIAGHPAGDFSSQQDTMGDLF